MDDTTKIKYFPKRSLKAYDGMSVTADVWEIAHDEHRDEMRSHILSMHKPGKKWSFLPGVNADHKYAICNSLRTYVTYSFTCKTRI